MMKLFESTRSSTRKSRSRIKKQTKSPSDYEATAQHSYSLEVSDSSPRYMKATSCSEGKRGQESPHHSESCFDSSDQSWSPSSRKSTSTLSRTSSFRSVKILINRTSTKSKRSKSSSNCQQVPVKSTCPSTLKDSKFPQHVELHPGQSESNRISKVKVCSYHHCSLNKCCDDELSPPVKRVYSRRRPLKSVKSIRLEVESTNADYFSIEETNLIQDNGVFEENEVIKYADLAEIVFGETSFPERSYQETTDIMRKYSTLQQDTLVITKCCNNMEREWDESTYVSDDVESNDRSVTTSVVWDDEDSDADPHHALALPLLIKSVDNVTTDDKDENINRELSKNELFVMKKSSESNDLVEAKCSTEFSFASASNDTMELEENLQETDGKANSTENADPNASAKKLHIPQFPNEKHGSMWSLIHRHMISDKSTELDVKVTPGADEEDLKDGGNQSCTAESSDIFSNFSRRESMTTNQEVDNQKIEVGKLLAIKLVQEAIERILLPEVQDQSSDKQSVTSEVYTKENFKESETRNEESDKASESDERSITRENTGSSEKQKIEGQFMKEAEKKAPKHWNNLKRWILLQRFIKELEKLRKFNPRKPRYLEPEPEPEAEKVNLKHQIEDERKRTEEWMLDYALQQAISQLAPTQKRKVGLLVTAFENVVPRQGSNIPFMFPNLKTGNEDNLQIADNVGVKYSTRVDKRTAEHEWSVLKNDDTQKAIVLSQKLDEVTSTLSDKVLVEGKAKQEVTEEENSMLEAEARINENECGDSNDSLKGTSFTTSILGVDGDEAQENNMIVPSASDENKKITESEDEDGTYIRQVINKQKHISMWHMISQHILSDVVSKVGNELLDGTDDDVDYNNTLTEMNNADNSLQDSSEKKDDISHYKRSFSRNDAVNLIREAVSQILKTPIQEDHSVGGEQSSTDSLCETKELATNTITKEDESMIPQAKSKIESPKLKNWSKLKKLILLKRSIKVLERANKLNPRPPHILLPPTPDQEQEKMDLRHQMADERKKAEQWMLENAVQHMVTKLTPAQKTRVAMLVEAFEAVVPLPEV